MKHAIGVLRYVAVFGLLLLGSAGTLAWPRAWILLGVLLIVHGVGTWSILRVNRALLDDRAKLPLRRDQAPADKVLLPASMLSFALLVSFDGFDAFRAKVLGGPGGVVSAIGLALFAGGWCLVEAALRTNAFATTVVRHQADRGHVVVSTGVYRVVRHPMYTGLIALMLGMGLWLGTYAGVLAVVVPAGLLVVRIVVEEALLSRVLPEYSAYQSRVRSRLIPGLW
jgi:protein-S-isoprenylcysteine O-methyltransferase Ste14